MVKDSGTRAPPQPELLVSRPRTTPLNSVMNSLSRLRPLSSGLIRHSGNKWPGFSLCRGLATASTLNTGLRHGPSPIRPFAGSRSFFSGHILKATHHERRHTAYSRGYGQGGSSWRSRLDNIPSPYIFWGVAGLNIVVFGKWYLAQAQLETNRDPRPMISMYRNFVASWKNVVVDGRV
jgi:hypothetical protein